METVRSPLIIYNFTKAYTTQYVSTTKWISLILSVVHFKNFPFQQQNRTSFLFFFFFIKRRALEIFLFRLSVRCESWLMARPRRERGHCTRNSFHTHKDSIQCLPSAHRKQRPDSIQLNCTEPKHDYNEWIRWTGWDSLISI